LFFLPLIVNSYCVYFTEDTLDRLKLALEKVNKQDIAVKFSLENIDIKSQKK